MSADIIRKIADGGGGGGLYKREHFDVSTTWTVPEGVTEARFIATGSGGLKGIEGSSANSGSDGNETSIVGTNLTLIAKGGRGSSGASGRDPKTNPEIGSGMDYAYSNQGASPSLNGRISDPSWHTDEPDNGALVVKTISVVQGDDYTITIGVGLLASNIGQRPGNSQDGWAEVEYAPPA